MAEAADFFLKTFGSPGTIEGIIDLFGGKRPLAEAMARERAEALGEKASKKDWNRQVSNQMRNLQRYTTGATETRVPKAVREVLDTLGKEKAQEVKGEQIKEQGITVTLYKGDFEYAGSRRHARDFRENRKIDYEVYIPGSELSKFVEEMSKGSLVTATEEFNEAYFVAYDVGKMVEMHNVTQLQWRIGE